MPEGEDEEQEIENLFEKIRKEKFPNLLKEIDLQVQEAQKVSNKTDPKRITPRHTTFKMSKIKDKERILKAAREKETVTYKGVPIRQLADFSKETLQIRRDWQELFKVIKARTYIQDYSVHQSYHLEWKGRKVLPRQGEAKGVHHHQALIT